MFEPVTSNFSSFWGAELPAVVVSTTGFTVVCATKRPAPRKEAVVRRKAAEAAADIDLFIAVVWVVLVPESRL
jgi:hypothetical protein